MQRFLTLTSLVISLLLLSLFAGIAFAQNDRSATLTWTPPTQNQDGTPLTNLAGYRIYIGAATGTYDSTITVDTPSATTFDLTNLSDASVFVMITAFNTNGIESDPSNEVELAPDTVPGAIDDLQITRVPDVPLALNLSLVGDSGTMVLLEAGQPVRSGRDLEATVEPGTSLRLVGVNWPTRQSVALTFGDSNAE